MGTSPCEHCTAVCCRYIALPIDTPESKRDFDDIRWYLMHHNVTVFVEEGEWYVQMATSCQNLLPDGRCGIYETRPQICREYKAGECDYNMGEYDYDEMFNSADEFEAYMREHFRHRRAGKRMPKRSERNRLKVLQ